MKGAPVSHIAVKSLPNAVMRTPPVSSTINKIGHALHDLDPVFRDLSYQPALAALVGALGLAEPLAL